MMNRVRRSLWPGVGKGAALVAAAFLAAVQPGIGQQGHPLSGSWHGQWGPPDHRMDLTVIMDWDGRQVTGLVNPVSDRAPLENAVLDSSDWTFHFEVDVADPSGQTRRCAADGRIGRLGSDQRTLSGAWDCGELKTEFELTRARDY